MAVREPSLTTVADIVASDMTAHFTQFRAVRKNVARLKLEEIATPVVAVTPAAKEWNRATRDTAEPDCQILICLTQRIDDIPEEGALTEDELIALGEEIVEWWLNDKQALTGFDNANTGTCVWCQSASLMNGEPLDVSTRQTDGAVRIFIQLDFKTL